MQQLKEYIDMERSLTDKLKTLAEEIGNEIRRCEKNGVTKIGRNMCIVKSNALDKMILVPSYYLQNSQADRVVDKLRQAKTATDFAKHIEDMVQNRVVRIGQTSYVLNDVTLSVLRKHKDG